MTWCKFGFVFVSGVFTARACVCVCVLQGKESFVSVVHELVDVHATVFLTSNTSSAMVPSYVYNHGIMSGAQLHQLLRESKVCCWLPASSTPSLGPPFITLSSPFISLSSLE